MRVTDKQVFKREEEMKRKPADGPGPRPSPLKKGGRFCLRAVPKVQPLYNGPFRVTGKVSYILSHTKELADIKLFAVKID